mmetsp:Transcript_944/g.2013  ORF Transcript_944/g.2013 Transcript_944/m.2013 type:complete len:351 (-) Transcript_944:388-1440(-)
MFIPANEERLAASKERMHVITEPSTTGTMFVQTCEDEVATVHESTSDIEEQRSTGRTNENSGRLNPYTQSNLTRRNMTIKDEKKYYPNDVYSFVALNGPTIAAGRCCWPLKTIGFFLFGLLSFVFQIVMFGSLVSHLRKDVKIQKGQQEAGIDITVCKVVSLLAYVVFPNSAQMDLLNAIKQYPLRAADAEGADVPIGCIRISCILRSIQANIAIFLFFFLIMSADNIVDIILNHTAVNFISDLDEMAFSLAKSGVFGPDLAKESRRIAHTMLPACSYRTFAHVWYGVMMTVYGIVLLALAAVMMVSEEPHDYWVTRVFADPQVMLVVVLIVVIAYSSVKAFQNRNQSTP